MAQRAALAARRTVPALANGSARRCWSPPSLLPFMPFADRKTSISRILILTYVMLGWGLNIVVGLAGLLDLGYVAFYAVGAYCYALLARSSASASGSACRSPACWRRPSACCSAFPVLRLRGDYLAIVTLGFGEIIRLVLINWVDLTGGPNGIGGIPRPTFFGAAVRRDPPDGAQTSTSFSASPFNRNQRVIFLYYMILVLALVTNFFTLRVRRLPLGRAWEALREDEIACRALGINPTNTKLTAFAIGAMFAGFAGSFFAARQGFISPESFSFIESAIILAIVVLGGMGSQIGVVLAALLLIGLPEVPRPRSSTACWPSALAMVLIMVWRPRGLLAASRAVACALASGAGRP